MWVRGRVFGQLPQAKGLGKPFMISFTIVDYSFDYIFLLGVLVTVRWSSGQQAQRWTLNSTWTWESGGRESLCGAVRLHLFCFFDILISIQRNVIGGVGYWSDWMGLGLGLGKQDSVFCRVPCFVLSQLTSFSLFLTVDICQESEQVCVKWRYEDNW